MKHSKEDVYNVVVLDLRCRALPKIRALILRHFSSQICRIADDKPRYGTDGATASKRRGDVGARWAGWRS